MDSELGGVASLTKGGFQEAPHTTELTRAKYYNMGYNQRQFQIS